MSSSRSIAAARNRRSGDVSGSKKTSQPGRPIQSIGGQSMLNNQPPQSHTNKQPSGKQPSGLPFSKLSVSDAVGLITLRLGKLEQFMIDSIENGTSSESGEAASYNKTKIDSGVIINMISRLDDLEKKQIEKANEERNIKHLTVQVNSAESSISQLKETLNQFIQTTNEKFADIENAFIEIEKNIEQEEREEGNIEEEEKEIPENEGNELVIEEEEEGVKSDEEEMDENIHFSVKEE